MRKLTETWKNKTRTRRRPDLCDLHLAPGFRDCATLVFMTNTETSVNSNYRAERVSSFGAKSGMEEVRDRMGAATTDPRRCLTCSLECLPGTLAGRLSSGSECILYG